MGQCRALLLDKAVMGRNNCILLQKNSPFTASLNREYETTYIVFETAKYQPTIPSISQGAPFKSEWNNSVHRQEVQTIVLDVLNS